MPSRDWQNRVRDVLAAISEIQEFTNDLTFEEFQADRKTVRAVLYNLAIIGEAVRSIPPEVEDLQPEIPWLGCAWNAEYCNSRILSGRSVYHLANHSSRSCSIRTFSSAVVGFV